MKNQGYITDPHSGARLFVPSQEEVELQKIRKLVRAIYESLPKVSKDKIDPELLEVIKND